MLSHSHPARSTLRASHLKSNAKKMRKELGIHKDNTQLFEMVNDSFSNSYLDHSHKNKLKKTERPARRSVCVSNKTRIPVNPENAIHRSTKKTSKNRRQIPSDFQSTKRPNKENKPISLTKEIRKRLDYERVETIKAKRLRNDLLQNMLQLFQISEKNLQKRQAILGLLRNELNISWKKLCESLQGSGNGSGDVVEVAVKTLVQQREFIEEEALKMSQIMEIVRI